MPNKITSKHNFRYVPRMNGLDIVKKLRAQIDAKGYKDVEMKLIGDVPWSRGSSRDTDITHAGEAASRMMADLGLGGGGRGGAAPPPAPTGAPQPGQNAPRSSAANYSNGMISDFDDSRVGGGGYWPSYLWTDGEVGEKVGTIRIPMGMGGPGGGGGGRNHAANEYYTLEGINKTGGMATAEKGVAATIWQYAQTTTTPPKPKKR
jgi:hypothetical protein